MRLSSRHHRSAEDENNMRTALSLVGGRLSYINKVMTEPDVVKAADVILEREKGWLLSQIGLIADCDDDVMDEVG